MLGDVHITTCDFELLSTCAAYVTGLGDKDFRRVRNAEELFAPFRSSTRLAAHPPPQPPPRYRRGPRFFAKRGKRKEGEKLA